MSDKNCGICRICFEKLNYPSSNIDESFCDECLRDFITFKIYDADITDICYPESTIPMNEEKINILLPYIELSRYTRMKLIINQKRHKRFVHCPRIDCKGFDFSLERNKYICTVCDYHFCFNCKNEFMNDTCINCLKINGCWKNFKFFIRKFYSSVQKCPNCKIAMKINQAFTHETCKYCIREWCWICENKIDRNSDHRTYKCIFGKHWYDLHLNILIIALLFPISMFFIFFFDIRYRINQRAIYEIPEKYFFICHIASFILSPLLTFFYLPGVLTFEIFKRYRDLEFDGNFIMFSYLIGLIIYAFLFILIIIVCLVLGLIMPVASIVLLTVKLVKHREISLKSLCCCKL